MRRSELESRCPTCGFDMPYVLTYMYDFSMIGEHVMAIRRAASDMIMLPPLDIPVDLFHKMIGEAAAKKCANDPRFDWRDDHVQPK